MWISSRRRRLHQEDCGGIITGWLVKLTVVLGLLGLAAFDALSISSVRLAAGDDGAYAARSAAAAWEQSKDVEHAYAAATAALSEKDPLSRLDPRGFRVDPDGTVHLRIARTADTTLVRRIAPFAHWAKIDESVASRAAG